MAGMLEIVTYLLCVYLVIKGIEVLQIALASSAVRPMTVAIGVITLVTCIAAAIIFALWQTGQAEGLSQQQQPVSPYGAEPVNP